MLDIAGQVRHKAGERSALGLAHIEHLDRLEQGNFDFPFLHDHLPLAVQHRRSGLRVQLHFLDLLLERRGGNDGQALFPLFYMTPKLVFPLVETGNLGGVGHLHMDEDGVVDRIGVKPGHSAQVLQIPLTLENLLDAVLNASHDLLDLLPVAGLFVRHSKHSFLKICNALEPRFSGVRMK